MKKLFFAVLLIQSINLQAQVIKGVVYSRQEKAAVEFSPVSLLHLPDSALVTGVSTQTGGLFTFENVKPGHYYVKATCLGCKPNGKNADINADTKTVNLDTIFVSPASKQLAEVNITGNRIVGKELVDRTVYSIPAEIAKSSMNGYEILRKIPGIQVDIQNNITLNGKSNFIIQVDGKQRDAQFLARLQPSDIESVEVINNPSGKYEGTIDGVINIILKKEARVGLNGNVSGMIRPNKNPSGYGAGSIDYGLGKITFYASGYSFFQKLVTNTANYYKFTALDSASDLSGHGRYKVSSSSINTGFDYYITEKNNLSLNLSYKPTRVETNSDNYGPIYKGSDLRNFMSTLNTAKTNSDEINASLFYKKQFAKPIQEFTSEATFYYFNSGTPNTFENIIYEPDNSILNSVSQVQNTTNKRNYLSLKVDYVQPIGFSARFEAGYQLYNQQMKYDFKNTLIPNNTFDYNEFRNAAYAGITFNAGKFSFQTLLRGEYSVIHSDNDHKTSYPVWLPSANILYKMKGSQNIKFTYNRRINRPSVYDLNPFAQVNGNLSISEGNPDLHPEYRDRLQLTYTLNFGKNNIAPYLYYEIITNKVDRVNFTGISPLSNDTTLFTMPANVITGNERGIGLNSMLLFFNINARFFQGHFNQYSYMAGTTPTVIEGRNYSSFSVTTYVYQQLKKANITPFAFFSYNGVNINAQTKTYSMPFYGFGAQKIAGNHTFGFFYFLPLSKNVTFNKTITETAFTYSRNTFGFDVSYFVQVMYSYKFNKGKTVKKINRKVEVESDTKSEGIK